MSQDDENNLEILHGGVPCTDHINYSPNPDTVNNTITGTVTSLSPFGIGYPTAINTHTITASAGANGSITHLVL